MSKETFRQRLINAPAERERERREVEAQAAREKAEKLRCQEEARQREAVEKEARLEQQKALLKKVAREFGLREKAEVFAEEFGISPDKIKEFVEVNEDHHGEVEKILFGYRVELTRQTGRKVGYKEKKIEGLYGITTHVSLSPGPRQTLTDILDLYASLWRGCYGGKKNRTKEEKDVNIGISSSQWKLLLPRFFGGSVYVKESYKSEHYWGRGMETIEDTLIECFEEIKNAAGRQLATREAMGAYQEKLRGYFTLKSVGGPCDGH